MVESKVIVIGLGRDVVVRILFFRFLGRWIRMG